MTRNEKRFNVIGTIGNGSALEPVQPPIYPSLANDPPVKSYHIFNGEKELIRYDPQSAKEACIRIGGYTVIRPIFLQFPPESLN